jgi:hypothetical protein
VPAERLDDGSVTVKLNQSALAMTPTPTIQRPRVDGDKITGVEVDGLRVHDFTTEFCATFRTRQPVTSSDNHRYDYVGRHPRQKPHSHCRQWVFSECTSDREILADVEDVHCDHHPDTRSIVARRLARLSRSLLPATTARAAAIIAGGYVRVRLGAIVDRQMRMRRRASQ